MLFKIGGAPNGLTLLENFQDVLSRMGIDVEFSVKDGTAKTDVGSEAKENGKEDSQHGSATMDTGVSYVVPHTFQHSLNPHKIGYSLGRYINEVQPNGIDHDDQELEGNDGVDGTSSDIDGPHTAQPTQDETHQYADSVAPSEATIAGMREALAYRHYRRFKLLKAVEHWKRLAFEQQEDNAGLAAIATHRDRQMLLQRRFDDWRSKLRVKQQAEENIDPDAALARRHIIRTKFFYAWRDYAIANRVALEQAIDSARKAYLAKHNFMLKRKYFQQW